MSRTVAERVASAEHAGALEGAHAVGEGRGGERLHVRLALWVEGGRLSRARFKATTCASLIAYADAACEALEGGTPPARLDAEGVRALVRGVHPVHHDRAALVAAGVQEAARGLRARPAAVAAPGDRGAHP
jgi:NifU-like protein involved in Fe-S cluster formation